MIVFGLKVCKDTKYFKSVVSECQNRNGWPFYHNYHSLHLYYSTDHCSKYSNNVTVLMRLDVLSNGPIV